MEQIAQTLIIDRAQDKEHILMFIKHISSQSPITDHLLESSHRDANKWSDIGFGEEMIKVVMIEA